MRTEKVEKPLTFDRYFRAVEATDVTNVMIKWEFTTKIIQLNLPWKRYSNPKFTDLDNWDNADNFLQLLELLVEVI